VSALREVALATNPTSGKGRGARLVGPVAERLGGHGIAVRVVTGEDAAEATGLVAAAVADGVDAVVALGGDGMVHLAAQAVCGTDTPLGIVPAGTGNDFAVALGVPTDPMSAVDRLVNGRPRSIDAVRSSGVWWLNVLGSGFDSAVNERANRMRWPKGKRRYDLAILAELRVFRPIRFCLTLDGVPWETEAMLVAVGNGVSYGAGMRITPDAVLDDGLLDVTVIGPLPRWELLRVFPTVYKGAHVRHPAVSQRRARVVRLEAAGQVAYVDGERLGPLPTTAECVPGAVRILS
jgi:diacylglycerol kinase (ATP)